MATRGDSALLALALLLCASVSAVTAVGVELLYLRKLRRDFQHIEGVPASNSVPNESAKASTSVEDEHQSDREPTSTTTKTVPSPVKELPPAQELPPVREKTEKIVLELRGLPEENVPQQLRLEAYVSEHHRKAFDHARVFEDCPNVFAVLDKLHLYLSRFFRDSEWMLVSAEIAHLTTLHRSTEHDDSDSDEDEELGGRLSSSSQPRRASYQRNRRQWRSPKWVDPTDTAEVVIYPDVDPATFQPETVINLEPVDKEVVPQRRVSRASSRGSSHGWSRSFESAGESDENQYKQRVIFCDGAVVLGGTFDVSEGSILIEKNVRIEPNVFIKGPTIIGAGSTLRSGAYIRGDVIVGKQVVLRGEVKNAIIMDEAELCHPGYCGDSICGFKSHFGNQVTTANLSLMYGMSDANLRIECNGVLYDTGRKKIGVILGDYSQLGCSSVTDPCTLIQPYTIAYPLSRLPKGTYGPNALIKNKPLQMGVMEIAELVQRKKLVSSGKLDHCEFH